MSLKKNKIFIILFFCLTILLTLSLKVNAANADITIETSTVDVGKSVKITVSGKGVQWNLKLKVDGELLKTDSELENYESNKNISFSAIYTPKTTGIKKVTLEGSVTEYSDGSTIKKFTTKTITVKEKEEEKTNDNKDTTDTNKNQTTTTDKNSTTIEKPKEKSNNAYLSTLGVTPKEYDFSGFNKTKTSYSVTVPSDVDSLKVLYKTADSGAKVKVSGNSGFETGSNNNIKIVVTAEDGKTTKTYTIKVTKLATTEEQPGNVIEDEEGLCLTSLKLEGVKLSPEFSKDVYSYTANLDDADATQIKVDAEANKEKANVEVSGNTDLVDGENTINILVTQDGSQEQTVYQVILTKAVKDVIVTNINTISSEGNGTLNDLMGNLKKYIIIAVAVIVLIIVAVIVLIILLRRENKKLRNEEFLEEDKNDDEYNVYKNGVNEFKDRSSEAENFVESLYRQRNGNLYNEEELDEEEKQTLEEINRETDKIFRDKVKGQPVEYVSEEIDIDKKTRRRERGKHSK